MAHPLFIHTYIIRGNYVLINITHHAISFMSEEGKSNKLNYLALITINEESYHPEE
jgi:hypothetical protein